VTSWELSEICGGMLLYSYILGDTLHVVVRSFDEIWNKITRVIAWQHSLKFESRNTKMISWKHHFGHDIIYESIFILLRKHLLNDQSSMYFYIENFVSWSQRLMVSIYNNYICETHYKSWINFSQHARGPCHHPLDLLLTCKLSTSPSTRIINLCLL
jgi:hypothetical protein